MKRGSEHVKGTYWKRKERSWTVYDQDMLLTCMKFSETIKDILFLKIHH